MRIRLSGISLARLYANRIEFFRQSISFIVDQGVDVIDEIVTLPSDAINRVRASLRPSLGVLVTWDGWCECPKSQAMQGERGVTYIQRLYRSVLTCAMNA